MVTTQLRGYKKISGFRASLTKRRIRKCRGKLGNGHDAELHETMADLYRYLGEHSLAVASYQAAAESLSKNKAALTTPESDRLINIYKHLFEISPLDDAVANKLGREYQRRGMSYRAIAVHTSLAEQYVQLGNYAKAIEQYQQVSVIEPTNITTRQQCAALYLRLGMQSEGALEYAALGDIYFDHQKFDSALEYYQHAAELVQDDAIQDKLLLTRRLLEEAIIPQAQASLRRLWNLNQTTDHGRLSCAEKEQIEQELRRNIQQLEQRYQKSVDQELEQQLQESLQREQGLRDQLRKLIAQHEHVLKRMEAEKRTYARKYRATQARIHLVENTTMTTLEHLDGELSRQCDIEAHFSEKLQESLQEIALLLHSHEQEIQQLAGWRT